jgi:hypothetical protein
MSSRQETVRTAILHWLQNSLQQNLNHTAFLDDPTAELDGAPVTEPEVEEAVLRMSELGLITGVKIEESPIPVLLHLTAGGKACLEYHQGSVAGWYQAQHPEDRGGSTTHIYGNSNQVATHITGNVTQIQTPSFSPEQLNEIRTVAHAVTDAIPSLPEDQQLVEAAQDLATEAEQEVPDPSRLARLRRNVLLAFERVGLAGAGTALGGVLVEQLNQLPL